MSNVQYSDSHNKVLNVSFYHIHIYNTAKSIDYDFYEHLWKYGFGA